MFLCPYVCFFINDQKLNGKKIILFLLYWEKCIITKETVESKAKPKIVINENKNIEKTKVKKKKVKPENNQETE